MASEQPYYNTLPAGKAAIALQASAETVCGRKLPTELFNLGELWWRRIIVIREPPEVKHGSIILVRPEKHPKSTGWVIAVGPDVGQPTFDSNRGASPYLPEELILRRVLFGRYAGMPIPVQVESGEPDFDELKDFASDETTPALMMTDMDIYASF